MKVKEESEKVDLKLSIQKTKILAYGPITWWQIDGRKMETVWDFIFLGSKITADGDCSQKIKRPLLLGGKVMTNLESILRSRDITLPTMVHLVKAINFPVVMYECECWTIKKAEHWSIDAFELWYWRRLESPLYYREIPVHPKGYQSFIFIRRTDAKTKTPIFGHLMQRTGSLEDADAGKYCRQEEKGTTEDGMVGWHHWLNGHEFE